MNENKHSAKSNPQVIVPYGYLPYPPAEEESVDLYELWQILKKRKFTVLTTVGLFFLVALLYLVIAKPTYEAKVTIEIGKHLTKGNDGTLVAKYFDSAKALKEYMDVKYDTAGKYRDKNTTTYINGIAIPKKSGGEGFLTIGAMGNDNDRAIEMLKKPLDEIMAKHKAYFETLVQKKKSAIENLKREIDYDKKILLPQLQKNLELLQSVELKKINEKISLVKSIDLKKIAERIKLLEKIEIPTLQEKIKQNNAVISKKESAIKAMQKEILRVAKQDPALATMTSMQMANLQNDIGRLKIKNIDLESQIKKIKEETIPNLKKQKTRILQETIPNLEVQKRRLLEEVIPRKEADIEKLLSITIPQKLIRIEEISTSMKEPYLVMTHVVGKIYTHDYPVKPKKKLIIAIALVTGLMLGIFLAFFLEFIAKKPEEKAS
ncbi:Wzz/FepE/Etk N-terminal domain-containing protein [Hydrogenimonas sp.]